MQFIMRFFFTTFSVVQDQTNYTEYITTRSLSTIFTYNSVLFNVCLILILNKHVGIYLFISI